MDSIQQTRKNMIRNQECTIHLIKENICNIKRAIRREKRDIRLIVEKQISKYVQVRRKKEDYNSIIKLLKRSIGNLEVELIKYQVKLDLAMDELKEIKEI